MSLKCYSLEINEICFLVYDVLNINVNIILYKNEIYLLVDF